METFLDRLLQRIKFLNLGNEQLVAEFASHAGWSLGVLFIIQRIFGDKAVLNGCIGLIVYGLLKETLEDGHLIRILKRTEPPEEVKDMITDILSRCICPLIVLCLELSKRKL